MLKHELLEIIGQHSPGDRVDVLVHRNGNDKAFQVELRNQMGNTSVEQKGDDFFISDLGAKLEQVPEDDKRSLKLSSGLKVVELQDGMLQTGGVQVGFIILQINGISIVDKKDVDYALRSVKNGVIRIEGIYPNGMRMNYGFIL